MEIALYHEPGGYYARPGVRRVGQEGDFFTSISVGPAFGTLLAHRIIDLWERNGSPAEFVIVEPGPEEGQLAGDILQEIATASPACHQAVTYHLLEPFESKHQVLREKLASLDPEKVQIHASSEEIPGAFGIVLANEILDALPVHLLELREGTWHERLVNAEEGKLSWSTRPCRNPTLLEAVRPFTATLPEGYQTEVCLGYQSLLASLASSIARGVLLFLDYGFSSADFYHPDRTEGTLQVYAKHAVNDDPFHEPGQCDLTTHVDFSRVLAGAAAIGLQATDFRTQESYLTTLAMPLFSAPEAPHSSDPSFIRQFRTLTHPSLLGGRFHALELTKGKVETGPAHASGVSGLAYLSNNLANTPTPS